MHLLRTGPLRTAVIGAAALAVVGGAVLGVVLLGPSAPAEATGPTPTPTASPTAAATRTPRPTASASPPPTPEPVLTATCPVNGLPLDGEASETVVAVQIENHPSARPPSNLGLADAVYEAPVEGDVTRWTAIFGCTESIGLTGPIRSARYYNVDLWQDLHVLTLGFGASNGALARFERAGMPYVNGLSGGWPWFRRYGERAAPHNLYMDVEGARTALEAGSNASLARLASRVGEYRSPFEFDPEVEIEGRSVSAVTIHTNSYWRFGWRWDAALGAWRRSDGGTETTDAATGETITARTVLVQVVTQETVYGDPDPAGNPRRLQHLVGSGTGKLYVDGRGVDVRWSRPSADAGTTWTHADSGEPVVLPPGRLWVEIVPTTGAVTES